MRWPSGEGSLTLTVSTGELAVRPAASATWQGRMCQGAVCVHTRCHPPSTHLDKQLRAGPSVYGIPSEGVRLVGLHAKVLDDGACRCLVHNLRVSEALPARLSKSHAPSTTATLVWPLLPDHWSCARLHCTSSALG